MADLFISYASEDRAYIGELIAEFESQGWTVWWDRNIETGSSFDRKIEEALDDALCVVVAWSQHSIKSDWVRAEAAEGLKRNILVPLLLDDVKPPLLFRQKQAISLIDWRHGGSSSDVPLSGLIPSIGNILESYKGSTLPISTQRSWVLCNVENYSSNTMLGEAASTALSLGLDYLENAFLYKAGPEIEGKLTQEEAQSLVEEEGLDGFIFAVIKQQARITFLTISIRVNGGASEDKTILMEDVEQLPSLVADLLIDLADVIQGHPLVDTGILKSYLKSLSVEALFRFSESCKFVLENDYEKARQAGERSIAENPNFVKAYTALSLAYLYLGQHAEAKEVIRQAVQSMDNVSNRVRIMARGIYYLVYHEDHEKAGQEFESLLNLSPFSLTAIGNLAVCHFYQLNFSRAREISARELQLYPDHILALQNAAFYALYDSAFDEAVQMAQDVLDKDESFTRALVVQVLSLSALDRDGEAGNLLDSYLGKSDQQDAVLLQVQADLAMARGQTETAMTCLNAGIAINRKLNNHEDLARKLLMKAELKLGMKEETGVVELMNEALDCSSSIATLATYATVSAMYQISDLSRIGNELKKKMSATGRAYSKFVDGLQAWFSDDYGLATQHFVEACGILDHWLLHFCQLKCYERSGLHFEAEDEKQLCLARAGEAVSASLDEQPTFRYLATLR